MGTITKALELLEYFSMARAEIGLGEFVKLTGRDKATLHRHLGELVQNGWLEQDPAKRSYRLGPAVLRLSAVRESTYPTRAILSPIVERLSDELGELAHASLLQGDLLSPICFADPRRHGVQVHFNLSEMLPLHATSSGISVLAFCPEEQRERVLGGKLARFTEHTVTDPAQLRLRIDEARKTGIAGEACVFDPEVASQAVAIYGAQEHPLGALSVSVPTIRATPENTERNKTALINAARDLTRSLGGSYPLDHPLSQS